MGIRLDRVCAALSFGILSCTPVYEYYTTVNIFTQY
jgi:hypothetical protein